MTIIRENDDGDKYGTFARLMGRLLDVAELFYQLLSEELRLNQQRTEEMRLESEQNLYMPYEFDWEFEKEWRFGGAGHWHARLLHRQTCDIQRRLADVVGVA